jgi:hypothetical protein
LAFSQRGQEGVEDVAAHWANLTVLEDRTPIRFAALLAKEIGRFAKPEGYAA